MTNITNLGMIDDADISLLVYKYGKDIVIPLNNAGANFSKLDGTNIFNIITKHGVDVITLLEAAGANFSKLDGTNIFNIIIKHGVDVITLLEAAGANFSKLDGTNIFGIITKYDVDVITPLKEAKANLNKLDANNLTTLIKKSKESMIDELNDKVNFAKLGAKNLYILAKKYGIDIIAKLSKCGADFSQFENSHIDNLYDTHGKSMCHKIDNHTGQYPEAEKCKKSIINDIKQSPNGTEIAIAKVTLESTTSPQNYTIFFNKTSDTTNSTDLFKINKTIVVTKQNLPEDNDALQQLMAEIKIANPNSDNPTYNEGSYSLDCSTINFDNDYSLKFCTITEYTN